MEYIFFGVLITYTLLTLMVTKDLLHPSCIFKFIWSLSLLLLLLYKDYWGLGLSIISIQTYLLGFVMFDIGYFLNSRFKISQRQKSYSEISGKRLKILLLIEILILIFCLKLSFEMVGKVSNISEFLVNLRYIMKKRIVDTSLLEFNVRFLEIIGQVSFVFYLNNNKKNRNLKITMIMFSLFSLILTTGRFRFMAVFTIYFFIYSIFKQKSTNNIKFQLNLIFGVLRLSAFFFVFFNLMGGLFNKAKDDFFNNFAIYFSGGMIAFSEEYYAMTKKSRYFGEFILAPIYNLIGRVVEVPRLEALPNLTIYGENGFATNVYTFYRQQILDFGIVGVVFVMFFLGGGFAILKKKAYQEEKLGFWAIIYSYFLFALIISIFMDTFFQNSTYNYFSIGMYYLIFKLQKKK